MPADLKTPKIKMSTLGGGAASDTTLLLASGTGLAYIFVFVVIGALINRKWD